MRQRSGGGAPVPRSAVPGVPDAASIFEAFLAEHPQCAPCLERICDRCDAKGELSGTVTLGRNLPYVSVVQPLHRLFGDAAKVTASGALRLSVDRWLGGSNARPDRERWLSGLYRALARDRVDRARQKADVERAAATIIERWRLTFPQLRLVADVLRTQVRRWQRAVQRHGREQVQGRLFAAGKLVSFLASNTEPVRAAELGARLCGDSKALLPGELRRLVGDWLLLLDGQAEAGGAAARRQAFERHYVVDNPTAVKVLLFGPFVYRKDGSLLTWIRDLWRAGESAVLSLDNLRDVSEFTLDADSAETTVCTCENETPFCRLKEERCRGGLIYTEGFPNGAVMRVLHLLAVRSYEWRHWGDSDLAGLRIAAMVHQVHPVQLWRCDLAELARHRPFLRPLTDRQAQGARGFMRRHPAFPFAGELQFLAEHGWLEQESWRPADAGDRHGAEQRRP